MTLCQKDKLRIVEFKLFLALKIMFPHPILDNFY